MTPPSQHIPKRCSWLARLTVAVRAAAIAIAIGFARPAWAGGVASLIEWDAPEGCAGALEMHARLSHVLGHEPETLGKLSRVRGSVLRTANGYRLVLEAFERQRSSSRVFEATSCDDLTDAAALAVAIAMAADHVPPDKALALSERQAADANGSGTTRPDDAGGTSENVVAAIANAPAEARDLRGVAAAAALFEYGALPNPAAGLAVAAGLDVIPWSARAYGVLFPAQALSVAPAQDAEFELFVGGLRGCYALRETTPRLNACAAFEAGRFRALGLGLAGARPARDLWLAAGAALEIVLPLSQALGVELRVEPMLPINRKEYTVNGTESVHAPAVVSSRLYVGLTFSGR